jgi:hypothetical protein
MKEFTITLLYLDICACTKRREGNFSLDRGFLWPLKALGSFFSCAKS